MNAPVKSHLKRKMTSQKMEPLNKSSKISNESKEAKSKLNSMKKSDLVSLCEELQLKNENLLEEKSKFLHAEKEHKKTIEDLEDTVKELKSKGANTSVYLCSECDLQTVCMILMTTHTAQML